jgi:hypothetical protein
MMRLLRRRHHDDILACPRCDSRLVQEIAATPRRDGDWQVVRRCPECEWHGAGRFSAEAYAEFQVAQQSAAAGLSALLMQIQRGSAGVRLFSDRWSS